MVWTLFTSFGWWSSTHIRPWFGLCLRVLDVGRPPISSVKMFFFQLDFLLCMLYIFFLIFHFVNLDDYVKGVHSFTLYLKVLFHC